MKKHFFTNSEEIGNNMPHFTNNGFEVVKCPDSIWEVITDLYKICLQAPVKEEPFAGLHNNAYLYDFEPYIGIVRHIHNSLLPLHEFWSNTILEPTAIWGIRSYTKGSQLMYHTDRPLTHHISCIVMVDKDLNGKEDWPLSIKGHDGKFYDVYTEPKDIILYESTACLHGRPKEFQGKYFRNFYMHYGVRDLEYVGIRNRK